MRDLKWKAHYHNGETLSQYNEDGSENGYHDIDRSRLSHFVLYENEKAVFSVRLHKGQRLIYRRRSFIQGTGNLVAVVYLVGWQMTHKGKNIKAINYIHGDGTVELDDDRNDLNLRPYEL